MRKSDTDYALEVLTILYDKLAARSAFTKNRITISAAGRTHLLINVIAPDVRNQAITLLLDGQRYPASWLKAEDRRGIPVTNIQLSYGAEAHDKLRQLLPNSAQVFSRTPPTAAYRQADEWIMISETDEPLVYLMVCASSALPSENQTTTEPESADLCYFPEGRRSYRLHVIRERNPALTRKVKRDCKRRHDRKLFCEACVFSFEEKYSEQGRDFIEAHHNLHVSELNENAVTDIRDIRMVCANCHRMLHLRHPWLKVAELKADLNARL